MHRLTAQLFFLGTADPRPGQTPALSVQRHANGSLHSGPAVRSQLQGCKAGLLPSPLLALFLHTLSDFAGSVHLREVTFCDNSHFASAFSMYECFDLWSEGGDSQ